MLALSTVWNAGRWETGSDIAKEIRQAGAPALELNFSLSSRMVEDLLSYCRTHRIPITSLHNFCPVPEGLARKDVMPDHYSLASLNESERQLAVKHTKNTVLTAERSQARCVVLHCGYVDIKDKTKELIRLCREQKRLTPEYEETLRKFQKERQDKSAPHTAQLLKSLEELGSFAAQHRVALGLENRFYYNEMPFGKEFGLIFNALKNKPLGLWLDTGHNYVLEQLGLAPSGQLLKNHGHRLLGVHFHNVRDLKDHQAVADGDMDFGFLKPYVKENTVKVMEFHGHVSPEKIRESMRYLEELFP
ncbi:MAG: sugar phosphate isomerase/epimerase [Candidatus Omnitrophota bacterium]